MRNSFNILVDAAGTATAISVIKGIRFQKKYNCKIIAMDVDPFVAGRFFSDKFYQIPPVNDLYCVDALLRICKLEEINLFVPIFDLGFPLLSKNAKKFNDLGTFMLLSKPNVIGTCFDKYLTYIFFKKNCIPTPRTINEAELPEKPDLDFPLFLKPRMGGRASINTHKVNNRAELNFYLKQIETPIIQEFLCGSEFTLDCLNTLDGKSCLGVVVRKRIETKGGLSVKSEVIRNDELVGYAKRIGETLGIVGPYNIQCFETEKGDYSFTEINPRFAGTHSFSITAGLNSILYILDMLNGVNVEPLFGKIQYGLKMVRYWNEIIIEDSGKSFRPW